MKIIILYFFCILFLGCTGNKNKAIGGHDDDINFVKINYDNIKGISGDFFDFEIDSKIDLYKVYQENNYKFSHFKCDGIKNYIVKGSVYIDEGLNQNNIYKFPGNFKICNDESMNFCLEKKQIENIEFKNLSCRVVLGSMFQKDKVIGNNILISKFQIVKAVKNK